MENLWLKIKIWTKISIFAIIAAYILIFTYNNADQEITIWVWFGKQFKTSALELIFSLLIAGVLGTFVFRMAFRAVNQIRELKKRNAATKMQKDLEEIKSKAGMLQTKPVVPVVKSE